MYNVSNICYFFTILLIALMAGLFFTWTISVTPGLAKLEDRNYLEAMQSLNKAILNPSFYIVFVGSMIILPLNGFLQYKSGMDQKLYMLIVAAAIYFLGSVAVTFFGNVPLNNGLEVIDLSSISEDQAKSFRSSFESRWNMFNMIRTLSSVASLSMLLIALLARSN